LQSIEEYKAKMKVSIMVSVCIASTASAFIPQHIRALAAAKANTPMFATIDAPASMDRQKTKAPVFDEVCETTGVTLTRFMNEVAILNPELRELTTLFGAIGTACKAINNLVKRSQLPSGSTLGYEGNVNIQGTDQKKLDVITNDLLKRALRFTGRIGVLASGEEDDPVDLIGPNAATSGDVIIEEGEKYVAVFDPLDESSNVDAGIPTGESVLIVD
jgi:fructose-1,6-bisphosphatase I